METLEKDEKNLETKVMFDLENIETLCQCVICMEEFDNVKRKPMTGSCECKNMICQYCYTTVLKSDNVLKSKTLKSYSGYEDGYNPNIITLEQEPKYMTNYIEKLENNVQKQCPTCYIEYGNKNKKLWFDDQRHFATFKFVKGKSELEKKLKTIGDDLLNDSINEADFINKYRKHNKKVIDIVLNNQKVFSGIGNYLKAEILYMAKISPHTKVVDIPDSKLKELLACSIDRIKASYKLGGASVENYSDLNNYDGKFQKYFKVYKQKKDPDGNTVISERISKPNDPKSQKTYWVPAVQKSVFN